LPDAEGPWVGATQLGQANRGRHMVLPGDPLERHQGPRTPSAGKPAVQGKGTGASPTRGGVVWPKTTVVVVVQGQGSDGGGVVLNSDRGGGDVGQQPHEEGSEQDR
jgi:hypothetical protein